MTPDTGDWTPADVPMARPAGRRRRISGRGDRKTPAETALKTALGIGLFVNAAALLIPRLLLAGTLAGWPWQDWRYGGDDFLLAAAVLLSGYGLLVAGRLSRRNGDES